MILIHPLTGVTLERLDKKDQGEWFFHKFFQPIIHHPKAPVASAGHSPPPLVSSLTSSSLTTKRNRSQQNNSWIAQNEALKAPMADGWTAPMRTWWTTKASTPMRSTGTKRNSSPARAIRETALLNALTNCRPVSMAVHASPLTWTYMRINRGTNKCGIANYCSFPVA